MLVVLVTLKISLQLSQHSFYLIFQTIRTIFVLCSGLQLDDEIPRLSKDVKSQNHYSWERPPRSSGPTIPQPPVSPTKLRPWNVAESGHLLFFPLESELSWGWLVGIKYYLCKTRLNQHIFQKILSKCSGKHDNMASFMHSNIYSRRRKGSIPHIAALVTCDSSKLYQPWWGTCQKSGLSNYHSQIWGPKDLLNSQDRMAPASSFRDHTVENPNLVILKEKDQVYIAISTLWICHGGKYATKFWLNKLNSG